MTSALNSLATVLRAAATGVLAFRDELTDSLTLTPASPPPPPLPPLHMSGTAVGDARWIPHPDGGIITVTTTPGGNVTRVDLCGHALPFHVTVDSARQPDLDGHTINYAELTDHHGISQTIGTPQHRGNP